MHKPDSLYGFLKDLEPEKDGSYNYDIKNRILDKYNKRSRPKAVNIGTLSGITSDDREVA